MWILAAFAVTCLIPKHACGQPSQTANESCACSAIATRAHCMACTGCSWEDNLANDCNGQDCCRACPSSYSWEASVPGGDCPNVTRACPTGYSVPRSASQGCRGRRAGEWGCRRRRAVESGCCQQCESQVSFPPAGTAVCPTEGYAPGTEINTCRGGCCEPCGATCPLNTNDDLCVQCGCRFVREFLSTSGFCTACPPECPSGQACDRTRGCYDCPSGVAWGDWECSGAKRKYSPTDEFPGCCSWDWYADFSVLMIVLMIVVGSSFCFLLCSVHCCCGWVPVPIHVGPLDIGRLAPDIGRVAPEPIGWVDPESVGRWHWEGNWPRNS